MALDLDLADTLKLRAAERRQPTRRLPNCANSATRTFVTSYGIALVYAGLGETDAAFSWLERAFEERSHWLVWLRLDPRWGGMRTRARFLEFASRLNHPGVANQ